MEFNQGWHYNFYNPASSQNPGFPTLTSPPVTVQPPVQPSVGLKVLSPTNKREFNMFKLREITDHDLSSPDRLKQAILKQVGADIVSAKLDFPVGFLDKSDKFWINNELDLKDAREVLSNGKLTLWCIGKDKRGKKRSRERSCDSDENSEEVCSITKRKSVSEERSSRVSDLKAEMREKHGSSYSGVQYSLWAEMIVAGTHESTDDPPRVPMFGSNRPRGRSNRLEETLTDVAGKIATALSPVPNPQNLLSSPIKSAELRGKYIQQLKEIVNLRDLGALTENEYEEHRSIIVNLMKKL